MMTHVLGVHLQFIIVHISHISITLSHECTLYNKRTPTFQMFGWYPSNLSDEEPGIFFIQFGLWASSHLHLQIAMWFHFNSVYAYVTIIYSHRSVDPSAKYSLKVLVAWPGHVFMNPYATCIRDSIPHRVA